MRLYIVRHAIAVPHGTDGVSEEARYLTDSGRNKMEQAAKGLRALKVRPEILLTSPLVRAVQTAEILQSILGGEIETLIALSITGRRSALYRRIAELAEFQSVCLVGHQPSLGEIAGETAFGDADAYLEFKKGGACAIELDTFTPRPRGSLLWFLKPSILRQLGKNG